MRLATAQSAINSRSTAPSVQSETQTLNPAICPAIGSARTQNDASDMTQCGRQSHDIDGFKMALAVHRVASFINSVGRFVRRFAHLPTTTDKSDPSVASADPEGRTSGALGACKTQNKT